MPQIRNQIRDVDIVALLESYGLGLKRSGHKRFTAVCPLHADEDPSLIVYAHNNSWYCFGCHKGGNAANWVMHREGCTFPEALARLGLKEDTPAPSKATQEYQAHKKDLLAGMRAWETHMSNALGKLIRLGYRLMMEISTSSQLEACAFIIDGIPHWEHMLEILSSGDNAEKLSFYRDWKHGR